MADATEADDRPGPAAPYLALLRSRLRAQAAYRASLVADLVGSAVIGLAELVEIAVVVRYVPGLGGLDATGVYLLFGLSYLGFALAQLVAGSFDTVPELVRSGTVDVLMLRPVPLAAQLALQEVAPRRLGGAAVGVLVAASALAARPVPLEPGPLLLLVLTPLGAAAVFTALFVAAGAVQFALVDAGDVTNAVTYGGAFASRIPGGAMPLPLRVFFTFVVPTAFAGYLPVLAMLGLPGPAGVPSVLGWFAPVVALAAGAVALLLWRAGVRHYTGAGG